MAVIGRAALLALLGTAILLVLQGPAHARELPPDATGAEGEARCGLLTFVQTYEGWGPALYYGGPVTIAYEASRCTTARASGVEVTGRGSATVFEGPAATGSPIDTRDFRLEGKWDQPTNPEGWPPDWWACGGDARYTWAIPDVYTFQVESAAGQWNLDVSTQGAETVLWQHDGCA